MSTAFRRLLRRAFPLYRPLLSQLGMLDHLARAHATDKSTHGYTHHYARHFHALRRRRVRLLEIGIGGYHHPDVGGTSLAMWRDYFTRGEILGLDLHDKSQLNIKGVRTFQGDQNDPEFLDAFAREHGPFDIIIDDGSHMSEHVLTSFRALFPHVTANGFYVVEDLFFSYDPDQGGSYEDLNSPHTSMGLLKSLVDQMHGKYIPDHTIQDYGEKIVGVSFFPKICFIHKGDNTRSDPHVEAYYAKRRPRGAQAQTGEADRQAVGAEQE